MKIDIKFINTITNQQLNEVRRVINEYEIGDIKSPVNILFHGDYGDYDIKIKQDEKFVIRVRKQEEKEV